MSQALGIEVELPLPVEAAVRMVRDALKQDSAPLLGP